VTEISRLIRRSHR